MPPLHGIAASTGKGTLWAYRRVLQKVWVGFGIAVNTGSVFALVITPRVVRTEIDGLLTLAPDHTTRIT